MNYRNENRNILKSKINDLYLTVEGEKLMFSKSKNKVIKKQKTTNEHFTFLIFNIKDFICCKMYILAGRETILENQDFKGTDYFFFF